MARGFSKPIQRNRATGSILGDKKLSHTVVDKLRHTFNERFQAKALDLKRIMRPDDTSQFRDARAKAREDDQKASRREQLHARTVQKAEQIKHRGGTLSLSGKKIQSSAPKPGKLTDHRIKPR